MSKRAPSTTQLLVIAGFALSCFGILLFLWVTFGGPTPFKAKPYQIKIPFDEATQLAEQSDVRISGVNVGKVQNIALAPNGKQALATVDIDDKYAPLPGIDPGDTPHQDPARRDLHRTHARVARGPAARRRRHPARGEPRPVGAARRDLPHLRPGNPGRLPGLDAGSRRGDRRAGSEPLLRDRRVRTDLHRIRPPVPGPRHPAPRRRAAVQQRRHDLPRPARTRRAAGRPDPQLQHRLPDDRRRATRTSKRCSRPSRPSSTSRS